jgi:hypothetical protein
MASWTVREDGSFDVEIEGVRLAGCYPAIDGVPVRPLSIVVERAAGGTSVEYRLWGGGSLLLTFAKDEDSLVLRSTLRGMVRAPHWVQPIAGATVEGAAQFFKQGLGFGGPSGFFAIDAADGLWSRESYYAAGLVSADDATLALGPYDHARFLFKATLANRVARRGLVDRHVDRAVALLECGFSTERVAVQGELALPEIHAIASPRSWDAFRRLAIRAGRVMKARPVAKPAYHWCSWYRRGSYFDRRELDELLVGLARIQPAIPLQTIQIDDGYCASPGDWLIPNQLWPGGLEGAFGAIRAAGYRAGVWIAPFMVGSRSQLYRQHPEWVLHGLDGRPVVEWKNYDNGKPDAHGDEETYALDTSNPEAFAWLRSVFKTLRGWGCRFFKTDFMDWGFKDSLSVKRHVAGKTSVELFRETLAMIRQEIGEDSYWLGCIAPFASFIGYADGMRVANDIGPIWNDGSAGNLVGETWADQWFNNVWWQNDPDCTMLRDRFTELSEAEVRALAYWNGVLGGSLNTSEYFQELPAERLKLWRFLEPDDKPWTATTVQWHRARTVRALAREYAGRDAWAVVALNPSGGQATEVVRVKDAIGLDEAYAFAWEPGRARPLGKVSTLVPELAPHSAALYYLSKRDDPPPPDLSLGGKQLANWVTGSVSR